VLLLLIAVSFSLPPAAALFSSIPLGQKFFTAFRCWMVVFPAAEIVRHALHVCDFFFEIMRILVAFAVADLLDQFRYGIAEVQRHGLGGAQGEELANRSTTNTAIKRAPVFADAPVLSAEVVAVCAIKALGS
jgi:hypothetical protein